MSSFSHEPVSIESQFFLMKRLQTAETENQKRGLSGMEEICRTNLGQEFTSEDLRAPDERDDRPMN